MTLQLQLVASAVTPQADNSALAYTALTDQSGEANHPTSGGALYRTASGPLGDPCVEFTALSSHSFALPDFMSGFTEGEFFAFIKCKQDPSTNDNNSGPILRAGDNGSGFANAYPYTDGDIFDDFGSTVRKSVGDPSTSMAVWHLLNVSSQSGEWRMVLYDTTGAVIHSFSTATNAVDWTTAPTLGRDSRLGYFNGYLTEITVFDEVLSLTDRATERNRYFSTYTVNSGTTSVALLTATSVRVSHTAATPSSKAPFDYQFQQADDNAGAPDTWADLGSVQSNVANGVAPSTQDATGLTTDNIYWFRVKVTDDDAAETFSDPAAIQVRVGDDYFVSDSDGSDSDDGLSQANAWATVGKVNTLRVVPGDTVSLNGGDTFSGSLEIDPVAQPSVSLPITVNAYGTGTVTIDPGDSYAIRVLNSGHVTIDGTSIAIEGPGFTLTSSYPTLDAETTSDEGGIKVATTTADVAHAGVTIDGATIEGCLHGIEFVASDPDATEAHDDVEITGCVITNCGVSGIMTRGQGADGTFIHDHKGQLYNNWLIDGNVIDECYGFNDFDWGDPTVAWSGFGMFLMNHQDLLCSNNLVHHCGEAGSTAGSGGPVGIILLESIDSIVRRNEVHNQYDAGGPDGNGIDFEACQNCIAEYNRVWDCEGSGLMAYAQLPGGFQTNQNNTFRYNIVYNCGTKDFGASAVRTYSTAKWYHNTFHLTKVVGGTTELMFVDTTGNEFYNNIFSVAGGADFGDFHADTVLKGNCYHVGAGSTFVIRIGGVEYNSLADMQAAGYEMEGETPLGAEGDPLFLAAPGTTGELLPSGDPSTFSDFDIQDGSAAIGCGVDLSEYGITPPTTDWHGETIPEGQFDAGAVAFIEEAVSGSFGVFESAIIMGAY